MACYQCAGESIKGDPRGFINKKNKLSADWNHKMRASKFDPSVKKEEQMIRRACEAIDGKRERKGGNEDNDNLPSAKEVVSKLQESRDFRKGVDWVNQLGVAFVCLLYGHKECKVEKLKHFQPQCDARLFGLEVPGVFPLASSKFLRLAGPTQELVYNKSKVGENYATWHCAACADKWTHKTDSSFRLMVTGCKEDEGGKAFVAFVGNTVARRDSDSESLSLERQINVLKGCRLLKEIGDKPVTKELVLQAIGKLNIDCEMALGTMVDIVHIQAADHKDSKYWARQLYCEDQRLSIPHAGAPFLALAVDKKKTPTLTPELLQMWLDFCASFVDLDNFQPQGPAERKAKKSMQEQVGLFELSSRL